MSRYLDPHLTCAIVRKNKLDMSLLNMGATLIYDANILSVVVRIEIFLVVKVSKKLTGKWWGQCEGFLGDPLTMQVEHRVKHVFVHVTLGYAIWAANPWFHPPIANTLEMRMWLRLLCLYASILRRNFILPIHDLQLVSKICQTHNSVFHVFIEEIGTMLPNLVG